jgi:hypothetical protein
MEEWDGWPFARLYLLLLAIAFLVVGAQVLLFHWQAAFRAKTMYVPVVLAPIIAASAVLASVVRNELTGWGAVAVFGGGLLVGLVGVGLHLRGVAQRIGGFTLRNVTAGPPFLLPLAYGALALTGGLAVLWQAL